VTYKIDHKTRSTFAKFALLTASILPLICGCEITDYSELMKKQELKRPSVENGELKEQVGSLQTEIATLEQNSQPTTANNTSESATPAPSIDQVALAADLEKLGVFIGGNESGDQIGELDFSDANYDNSDLAKITPLPALKKLIVNGSRADLETFEQIRCAQTRISNEALRNISASNSVSALDLSDCNQINDEGLIHLPRLKNLKFLKIWGQGISDAGMQHVRQLTNLNVLGLNDTRVTDDGISQLSGLKNLREVHLFRTAIGDKGMEVLSSIPSLSSMNLRDTKISDDSITYLSRLDNLVKLDLSETNAPGITDDSAATLLRMKNLKSLNLWSTKISDATVEQVVNLPALEWLNLDKTSISNESITYLSRIRNLKWLHIGSTEVNDDCVESLLALPNLKYLNVSNSQISGEKFFELYEKLSVNGCEVIGP